MCVKKRRRKRLGVWLAFYGISTFVGYFTPNLFYADNQFYFKQFSSAKVRRFDVNIVLFQAVQFSLSTV